MGKKRLPYSERITTNITMRRIIDEKEKKDLGKIQIAAPDDAHFGKKRPQMLHRIQPCYPRKCDHSAPYSERITTNITMRRIIDEKEKKDLFCI